ncbi:hypothetical protein ACIRPH_06130 [Nocardiopsis sp. NPDC101807]|uniref:hypothetical protein n=1 Tax=Nocardiopsis sp. NPDC101807 TaxID=3364339 RepID=UPI00381A9957
MALDLYTGIPVTDRQAAPACPSGSPPTYVAGEPQAGREPAGRRCAFAERRPERAGRAVPAVFVDGLGARVRGTAGRGVEPVGRRTCPDGAREGVSRDPEGGGVPFGGGPL